MTAIMQIKTSISSPSMELDQPLVVNKDNPTGPQDHGNDKTTSTTADTNNVISSLKTTSSESKDDHTHMGVPTDQSGSAASTERKKSWLHACLGKARTRNTRASSKSKDGLFDHMGVPKSGESSSEGKLAWLQSQIIIGDQGAEFDSPFGKRRLVYADHASSGLSLRYIEDYIINNVLPFYGDIGNRQSHVGQRTNKMLHEASRYIKKRLGGRKEDAIMVCGSGSKAAIKKLQEVIGIAVAPTLRERLIKCLRNEESWVVFTGPHEHPRKVLSWRQSLAEVVEVGLDDNGLINIEELRKQLELYKNTNRPMLGFFSASSNVTGIYSDTRSIARVLHQYGGFACFDLTASGPYAEIDMRSGEIDGYDAIIISPHKFLGGPGSPGILLMSKAIYQLSSYPPSITCGVGSANHAMDSEKETIYLDDIEEREDGGTPQIIQTIRASLAFWVKEYIGYEVIKAQEETYIQRALERLLPNQNIKVLGNTSTKRHAILSFLIYSTTNSSNKEEKITTKKDKPLHGAFVATLFNDLFGIQAHDGRDTGVEPDGHTLLNLDKIQSRKIHSAIQKGYVGVKPGWTRISFPYYMSNEEFEFILAATEFIVSYGQQFLALYSFNFEDGKWCIQEGLKKLTGKRKNKFKPVASAIREVGLPEEYICNADIKQLEMIYTYASYMEDAREIASQLPKSPPQASVPEDINPNILEFRI